MDISANITRIQNRIISACERCGRDPGRIRLVAVSKKKPVADIEAAFAAGQKLFGESYVQEYVAKADQIQVAPEWHFIGVLQSNKVKYLRGKVKMIHSVDRLSLAREIDRQWQKESQPIDILLQVNLGEEESKSGTTADALIDLAHQVTTLPHVQIKGLMTLPPWFSDAEQVRPYFRQLGSLAKQIEAQNIPNVHMDELSMGMSHDFEIAIEEGATLIRVGTAIFGERE